MHRVGFTFGVFRKTCAYEHSLEAFEFISSVCCVELRSAKLGFEDDRVEGRAGCEDLGGRI